MRFSVEVSSASIISRPAACEPRLLTGIPMPDVENDDSLRRDLERALLEQLGNASRRADRDRDTRLAQEFDLVGDLEVLREELGLACRGWYSWPGRHTLAISPPGRGTSLTARMTSAHRIPDKERMSTRGVPIVGFLGALRSADGQLLSCSKSWSVATHRQSGAPSAGHFPRRRQPSEGEAGASLSVSFRKGCR